MNLDTRLSAIAQTTAVVVAITNGQLVVASVGDSGAWMMSASSFTDPFPPFLRGSARRPCVDAAHGPTLRSMDTEVIRRLRDRLVADGRPSLVPSTPRGLSDLTPYEMASLERVEPLAELLFLAMCADGRVDAREEATLRGTVRTLTDGLLRGQTSDRLVARFRDDLEREGYDERMFQVTQRLGADRDDAELGVLLFAAVALSDGTLDDEERAAFDRVTAELGVSPRRVRELLAGT